jgi:peptidoglycan/LPS O-acetylase OafA/YrhL
VYTGGVKLAGRVRALDGLRGIALVAVLAYHAAPDVATGGFLGVEMFFVLSGFLLISLLLEEEDRRGLINPWAYAAKRVRRIFPALVVMLMAIAVIVPLIAPDDAHRLAKDIGSSLLGITNWHLIAEGSSYFAQTGRPPLVRHLWSIAIELQVYVLIPFIAAFLARNSRRRSLAFLLIGIASSATAMAVLYESPDPSRAYFGTDTRIGALLTGALVALVVRELGNRRAKLTKRASSMLFVAGAAVLWVLFIAADERARVLYPAGFLATQLATAGLIVAAVSAGWPSRLLEQRALRWLGVRSYGIYLFHWPIVALVRPGIDVDWPRWVTTAGSVALAVGLGALSYRFVERPFLSASGWARRPLPLTTRVAGAAWVTAMVVIVALVARTGTVDPIAESLLAGEQVLAEQETGVAPGASAKPKVSATPVAVSGKGNQAAGRPVAAPGKLPTAKGPKRGSVKLSAVGDSVMLGAAEKMKSRFGAKSYISAKKNRRWSEAKNVVREFRVHNHLGRVLILHLGNNGPMKAEDVEAVLRQARPAEEILLVTVRVSKPWQKAVNDTLRQQAKKHAHVEIVDWNKASGGHRDWFYSDGTHVNPKGGDAYVKLIAGSIPPEKPKETKAPSTSKPKPTPTPGPIDGVLDPD